MHVTQIWRIAKANPQGLSTLHMPIIYSQAGVQLPCVGNVCKRENMEANVSDLHAAASNPACEANPSNFKVAIFFANRLYHLSSSGALKKNTVCMSCLWSFRFESRVNLTHLTQPPFWLRDHAATNPEKLLRQSGHGGLVPQFWRAHNGRRRRVQRTGALSHLRTGAFGEGGREQSR